MNSRDKKAVQSLKRHRDRLKDTNVLSSSWVISLSDMLRLYVGDESQLYHSTKFWIGYSDSLRALNACKELIDEAIAYIENNGVVRKSEFSKFVDSLTLKEWVTILTAIITTIITFSGASYKYGYEKGRSAEIDKIVATTEESNDSSKVIRTTPVNRVVKDEKDSIK